MSAAFERAWAFIMRPDIEGGSKFVNDPDDPGGATRWGISQRAYPSLDIRNLTEAQAKQIYFVDYWKAAHCAEIPEPLAVAVFDAAVNQGVGAAVTLLQEAVKANPDGQWGPKTQAAVTVAWKRFEAAADPLRRAAIDPVNEFLSRRALRYADGKPKFRRGWMLRLFKLRAAL